MGSSSSKAERRPILSEKSPDNDQIEDSGSDSGICSSESDTDGALGSGRSSFNWGWLVVFASFYCVAMVGGVGYITGGLMEILKVELSGNIASISLAGSVQVTKHRIGDDRVKSKDPMTMIDKCILFCLCLKLQ